jgi:hypothetical protein
MSKLASKEDLDAFDRWVDEVNAELKRLGKSEVCLPENSIGLRVHIWMIAYAKGAPPEYWASRLSLGKQ